MVFAAVSFIILGDAAAKVLTARGFSPFFIAWTRFALGALLLLPVSRLRLAELPMLLNWRVLLRAVLITGAICSVLTALKTEAMANVFGGFFVGPIIAFTLSALLLNEKVTLPRIMLLLLGFGGVLLVVRPGFGAGAGPGLDMGSGMVFAVLAGCLHGCYLTATRWLAPHYRPGFLLISQLLVGVVLLAPFAIGSLGQIATLAAQAGNVPWLAFLVIASAAGSAAGNYLIVTVNRTLPGSLVAPLMYSQLIAATIAGYVFFGDRPDLQTLCGISVIILSGFGSLWLAKRAK